MTLQGQYVRNENIPLGSWVKHMIYIQGPNGKTIGIQVDDYKYKHIETVIKIGDYVTVDIEIEGKDYIKEDKIINFTWLKLNKIDKIQRHEEISFKAEDVKTDHLFPEPKAQEKKYDDLPF